MDNIVLENLHPWDRIKFIGGGECDVLYQCDADSFVKDGYEWKDEKWWKDGKPLWVCECWKTKSG